MKKWLLFPLLAIVLTFGNGINIDYSHAQSGDACTDIDTILSLPTSPGELVSGGDVLSPGQIVSAEITADDAGDRWVIPAISGAGQLTVEITENDIPLAVTLLRGFEEIRSVKVAIGGGSFAATIPSHGYYTLVVHRESVIDSSVTGSYSLTAEGAIAHTTDGSDLSGQTNYIAYLRPFGGTDGTIRIDYSGTDSATINVYSNDETLLDQSVERLVDVEISSSGYYAFRVNTTGAHSLNLSSIDITGQGNISIRPFFYPIVINAQIEDPAIEDGLLTIVPQEGITIQTYVDGIRDVAIGGAVRLVFANSSLDVNGGSLSFVRNELESLTILENGLTVTRTGNRQLYVKSLDVTSQLSNDNGFQNFTLPDGRSMTQVAWSVMDRVVLLDTCAGAQFENGFTFVAAGQVYSLGGTGTESGNQIVRAETEDIGYRASFQRDTVVRVEALDGRINLDTTDGHALSVDRLDINLTIDENDLLEVIDNDNDARLLLTDWEHLNAVTVDGLDTTLDTTDLRGLVVRTGRELSELEARDGAFDMVWADGTSTLLLNEAYDYIQIESPAALPGYDPQARPGEDGYLPSNMNNTGQECSPVNTAFHFNCTDNGLANPVNGSLSMTVTDLFARGYRLDLQLTRTYNSANAGIDGPFGEGWDSNIVPEILGPFDTEQRARIPAGEYESALDLSLAPLGQITLKTASGSRHIFTRGETQWSSPNLPGWSAEIRSDDLLSPWRILSSEGLIYEYDVAGRLRDIRHYEGGHIEIERDRPWLNRPDDDPPVYMITDDTGRTIRLEFDNNAHVVRAELVTNDEVFDWVTFTYEGNLLVGVTHQDGAESTYEYQDGRLVHHIDEHAPLASELYYAYNNSGQVCNISIVRPNCEGGETSYRSYRYNEDSTRVRNEWGHVQLWSYSIDEDPEDSYLLRAIEPGGMTEIEYASNNVVNRFSRNGVVHNLLNTRGNFTQLFSNEWIGFLAEYGDIAIDIDGDGTLDEYSIERLLSYDTDPNASFVPPTEYEYDTAGRLVQVDSEGVTTLIEHDNSWSLPSQIVSSQGDNPGETIQLTYDSFGFVRQRIDASGTHNFAWNEAGQLLEYTLDVASEEVLKYSLSYENDCTLVEDHLGSEYTFCYNHSGLIVREAIEAGDYFSETRYQYDQLRRIASVEQFVDENTIYVTTYKYDKVRDDGDWRVTVTNPDGIHHITDYDWQGRVVQETDAAGRVTAYEYGERESDGTVITIVTFPNGNERTYLYNRTGQLCSVTQGETAWQFVYDTPNCRISGRRLPSQLILSEEVTIRFEEYDNAGRPTRIEYFVRRPDPDDPDVRALSSNNDAPGIVMLYEYDVSGRLVSIVNDRTGASRSIDYTVEEGVTEITEQVGGTTTRYRFDPLGRLVSKINNAGSATYLYSEEGQTVTIEATFTSENITNKWSLIYNAAGQLLEWVNEDNFVTRYTYDGLGRLKTITRNDEVLAEYQYDASNHVTVITDASSRQASYVYDAVGQLTTVVDFDGTFETFIYNPFGNLRTSIDSLGFTTIYDYDEVNRLTGITDPIGYRAEFDWRDDGRLIYDDGRLETTFYHDPLGRLWQIRGPEAGNENIHRFNYNFDAYLAAFSPWDDRFTYTFESDDQGQVTNIEGPDDWALDFVYDDLGRLVVRNTATESTELNYDRLGRLIALGDKTYTYTPGSVEKEPSGEVLTYDGLYRLLSDMGRTITYSGDGQTITVNYQDGFYDVITYADAVTDVQPFLALDHYTPENVLFRERQYFLNARGDLILQRVIDYFEEDHRYQQEFSYSYDAVGRPIRFVDSDNNLFFYSYDTKGDLISVQFPDGNVYQYGYDALRNLIAITNPAGQVVTLDSSLAGEVMEISLNGEPLERYDYSELGWLTGREFVDFADSNSTTGDGQLTFTYGEMGETTGWQVDDTPLGQITTRCVSDVTQGVAWRYLFDDEGRVSGVTTLDGGCGGEVIQRLPVAYDSRNRITTNSILEHSYTYEDGIYTLSTMYESGETINISFDNYLHIESIDVDGEVIDVEYSSAQLDLNTLEVRLTWGGRYISNVRFNRSAQTTRIEYLDSLDPTFFLPIRYTVTYDGLPLSIIQPLRNNIVIGYDSSRRPLSTVWLFAGRESQGQTGTVDYSFTLTYDNLGNRIRESLQFPDGEQLEFEYEYDEGNLLVERRIATDDVTDADSTSLSTQGYAGLTTVITMVILVVIFRRRLTLRILISGMILVVIIGGVALAQTPPRYQYTYNERGHVATAVVGENDVLTFEYDAFGRIVSIEDSSGVESTFTYNGFYQLASYTTEDTLFEYVYDAGRPVGVSIDGDLKIFAGIFNDQPLLMKNDDESQWLLYDGQGTLRQTFVDEPTGDITTVNSGTDILGRSVNPGDSLSSLPAGIPVFNGMLFDETSSMLVTLDGRVYDPLVGRFLQRDVLGPDASGNVYGYTPLRDEPPVAHRTTYPFAEAFQLLNDLDQRLTTPMASDVLDEHMPNPNDFWLDDQLALLNNFNAEISNFKGQHLELPQFVSYAYNPPGVIVDPESNFNLLDLTSNRRVEVEPLLSENFDAQGTASFVPMLDDIYSLAVTTDFVQNWYDADAWQERTQATYTGLAPVDSIDARLDAYFQNTLVYADLFAVLENMPDEDAGTWELEVEAENLPALRGILPADPAAWLERWLTTDTIPTWTQLRNVYQQLPVPGSAARDVRLPAAGN